MRRRFRVVLAVLIAAGLGLGWSAGRADALGGAATSVLVTLTDHRARVHADTYVRYVAALTNNGPTAVRATLRLDPPRQAARHRTAMWHVEVRPGSRVRRHMTVRIGSLGAHAKRLTATASVFLRRTRGAPLIRTVDADRIEHAAVAGAGPISLRNRSARAGRVLAASSPRWGLVDRLYVGIPAGVLAGLVLLLALVARRRAEPNPRPTRPGRRPGR